MKARGLRKAPAAPAAPSGQPGGEAAWRDRGGLLAAVRVSIFLILATLVLWALRVPLGKPGTFTYLYSPLADVRAVRAGWLLVPGALLMLGAALAFDARAVRRRCGAAVFGAGALALSVWTFVAPPSFAAQHYFNMMSPAQDGAFLSESGVVGDTRAYLRAFPDRAALPPAALKGTRVLSNPPGTTLLALGVRRALAAQPWMPDALFRWLVNEEGISPAGREISGRALAFALVLQLLGLLALLPAYICFRVALPFGPAVVLCGLLAAAPPMLLFSSGKDPAQLLTVLTASALTLWAARRGSFVLAALSGAAWTLGLTIGLVHLWVAAVLAAAALAQFPLRRVGALALTAAGAAAASGVALWAACGLDLIGTSLAVAAAQGQVTRGAGAMPLAWQLVGIPLFVLFSGPGVWSLALRSRVAGGPGCAAPAPRGGFALTAGCVAAMILSSGFTNAETPRLWLPLLPLLALGLAVWRQAELASRRWWLTVLALQLLVSGVQWSLMDMRESETRLLTTPAQDARFFD